MREVPWQGREGGLQADAGLPGVLAVQLHQTKSTWVISKCCASIHGRILTQQTSAPLLGHPGNSCDHQMLQKHGKFAPHTFESLVKFGWPDNLRA